MYKIKLVRQMYIMMKRGITMLIAEQDSEMARLAENKLYIMESGVLREPGEEDLYLL